MNAIDGEKLILLFGLQAAPSHDLQQLYRLVWVMFGVNKMNAVDRPFWHRLTYYNGLDTPAATGCTQHDRRMIADSQ